MSAWFAHALFFCTSSVEACEFVSCEVPDFETATRMIGSRVVLSDKIDFISTSTLFAPAHFSCSHSTHTHLLPRSLHQEQLLRSSCRSINPAKIHKMKSVALWLIQPLQQVMSPRFASGAFAVAKMKVVTDSLETRPLFCRENSIGHSHLPYCPRLRLRKDRDGADYIPGHQGLFLFVVAKQAIGPASARVCSLGGWESGCGD